MAAKQCFHAVDDHIKSAAGAQHADSYQHTYQVRDDPDGCFKATFGAFYKSIEDVYLFIQARPVL